jgi:hypothetical protein
MFYVYVYKDPRPSMLQQVVYVGKGTGRRAFAHWGSRVLKNKGFGHFLATLRQKDLEPIIEIVKEFESEEEAFLEEIRLISLYGRRDLKTGTLFNLTIGGEGISGTVRTEEWNVNISKALSTVEHKTRNADAATKRWANSEYRNKTTLAIRKALANPEVAKRREDAKAKFIHTKKFRRTMRRATLKLWKNNEYKEKVLLAQKESHKRPEVKAKKSENSKKLWEKMGDGLKKNITIVRNTPESKAKTSRQAKAQWADEEYRAKQTAANREISTREEVIEARKRNAKAKWDDPEWRAKMMALKALKKKEKESK